MLPKIFKTLFGSGTQMRSQKTSTPKVELISKSVSHTVDIDVLERYPTEVEQIHHEFEIAGELIYKDAVKLIQDVKINNLPKVERLKKLGFTATEEVIEAADKLSKVQVSQELSKKIEHYKMQYPFYKFISQEQLDKICEKYGLIYGEISLYKGFVPEKKLEAIEEFKKVIKESDCKKRVGTISTYGRNKGEIEWDDGVGGGKYPSISKKVTDVEPLIIAAPSKDFDLTKMEVKNYKIQHKVVPDPVVMQPVDKGYLIVTAWGDEASDENVVNEKFN